MDRCQLASTDWSIKMGFRGFSGPLAVRIFELVNSGYGVRINESDPNRVRRFSGPRTALADKDGIRGIKVLPGALRLGSVVIQIFSYSTQLRLVVVVLMLINVKMPTG